MLNRFVIGIDPSGNWNKDEKGGTGIVLLGNNEVERVGEPNKIDTLISYTIWAHKYSSKETYYNAIIGRISHLLIEVGYDKMFSDELIIVIEDFKLQSGKAAKLSNQQMQTPELIGFLESKLNELGIYNYRQQNTIKSRWPNDVINIELRDNYGKESKDILLSRHARDALRHALNAWFFPKEKKDKE